MDLLLGLFLGVACTARWLPFLSRLGLSNHALVSYLPLTSTTGCLSATITPWASISGLCVRCKKYAEGPCRVQIHCSLNLPVPGKYNEICT